MKTASKHMKSLGKQDVGAACIQNLGGTLVDPARVNKNPCPKVNL